MYRAIDQFGQVVDVWLSTRRDLRAAGLLRPGAGDRKRPDRGQQRPRARLPEVLDRLLPGAMHITEQYANNSVECDHGRLKARLRPMRGLKSLRSARIVPRGHALVQNIRRGHYDVAADVPARHRLRAAFDEVRLAI
jgi:transposase, IS6 family